ncbi:MAG: HAMP domain-containing histidine kinase [Deltaproteobacteria bacterium]|nr:HAMP domain-containing histidine kinase [Deltaproteobacteria bacterium]
MKKLTALLVLFSLAISIPLVYLMLHTYRGIEQEELAELRYFAETVFFLMEAELGDLVALEESRPIEAYNAHYEGPGAINHSMKPPYILAYMQNNPDGSFQTPLAGMFDQLSDIQRARIEKLKKFNDSFNRLRHALPDPFDAPLDQHAGDERYGRLAFAEKYLRHNGFRPDTLYERDRKRRVENLTPQQVLQVAQADQRLMLARLLEARRVIKDSDILRDIVARTIEDSDEFAAFGSPGIERFEPLHDFWLELLEEPNELLVEIDPLQTVLLDDNHLYLFRKIQLNNQLYCQGAVIRLYDLLAHLMRKYFADQPMTRFTHLSLTASGNERIVKTLRAGTVSLNPVFALQRPLPRPFSFLQAKLTCDTVPGSAARTTLNRVMILLAATILIGLLVIYKSVRAVVELSERRAGFVSAVTHELKTPLSTIRMYIEMLEQGIARSQDREHEYYRILGSETSRLSRLINNVLEFARIEKRQRRLNRARGTFDDVFQETAAIMQTQIQKAGFVLRIEREENLPECAYDREAMIQILINLIENSLKFGARSPVKELLLRCCREGRRVRISLSDSGPGIPRSALKKIFENFYRVDNDLTRTTGGTGIGLALVKSLVTAMGGRVRAVNNDGPGCTIIITMTVAGTNREAAPA